MKTRSVGVVLFHVGGRRDRQTNMTTLIVTFHERALEKQRRQCTAHVTLTLWRVRVTIVAMKTQQCILCVLLRLHVTVNCIKLLSVAQQWCMANLCRRQQ